MTSTTIKLVAGLSGLIIAVLSCSRGSGAASISEAAKAANCSIVEYDTTSQNLFNAKSVRCADSSRVYWFPTPEAQKNHAEICKQAGGLKVADGDNWTKYNPSC